MSGPEITTDRDLARAVTTILSEIHSAIHPPPFDRDCPVCHVLARCSDLLSP